MISNKFPVLTAFSLMFMTLLSYCKPRPDLIPAKNIASSFGVAYCNLNEGKLTITVENFSEIETPSSITSITFPSLPKSEPVLLETPALPGGSRFSPKPLELPPNCFRPDCEFIIEADFDNRIEESNEKNNKVTGSCPG